MVPIEMMPLIVMIGEFEFSTMTPTRGKRAAFLYECGKCVICSVFRFCENRILCLCVRYSIACWSLNFILQNIIHWMYVRWLVFVRFWLRPANELCTLLIFESVNIIFSIKLLITCTIYKLWHPTNYSAYFFLSIFSISIFLTHQNHRITLVVYLIFSVFEHSQWLHWMKMVLWFTYYKKTCISAAKWD